MSRLMVWVPSCPKPLAEQSLLDAAIDFCQRTECVRYVAGPVAAVAGQATYTIPLPQDVRVRRIHKAEFLGRDLSLDTSVPSTPNSGEPWALTSPAPGVVTVYPTPDKTVGQALAVHAILEPTRNATLLPDELFHTWCETIIAGAVYRITSIPDQSFSNPMVAADASARYQMGLSRASAESDNSQITTNARVRANPLV